MTRRQNTTIKSKGHRAGSYLGKMEEERIKETLIQCRNLKLQAIQILNYIKFTSLLGCKQDVDLGPCSLRTLVIKVSHCSCYRLRGWLKYVNVALWEVLER